MSDEAKKLAEDARRILAMMRHDEQVAKLSDADLRSAVVSEVWEGLEVTSLPSVLLGELLSRFARTAGLEGDVSEEWPEDLEE